MRRLQISFEPSPSLDRIEVLIRAPEEDEQVAEIIRRLSDAEPETLTVFDRRGTQRMIPTESVVCASVDGKQVRIVTEDDSYYTRHTMKNLESILDGRRFIRVSRYEIVNLTKIRRFDFTLAGTLRLELAGGIETWASRRCIPAIRRRLTGKE